MQLVQNIKYELERGNFSEDIHGLVSNSMPRDFKTLDELRKNTMSFKLEDTYSLRIKRIIQIMDKNIKYKRDQVVARINGGEEYFWITNKIWHPSELKQMLIKKYNTSFDFKEDDDTKSILFNGVLTRILPGMTLLTPYGLRHTTQTLQTVTYRVLTKQDNVLDKNLNMIWPVKSDKTPEFLIKFLNQGKEIIR